MKSLNRFENHVINTSKECTAFVKSVRELEPKASNVSVMLDTFHMNIEEEVLVQQYVRQAVYWDTSIQVSVIVWFREEDEHLGERLERH